jgi:hypothetical protein
MGYLWAACGKVGHFRRFASPPDEPPYALALKRGCGKAVLKTAGEG